jgi:hypothetical protein
MAAKKLNPSNYQNLYEDKRIIEALTKRLNDSIQKDPKLARKAALIIEQWLKKTKL